MVDSNLSHSETIIRAQALGSVYLKGGTISEAAGLTQAGVRVDKDGLASVDGTTFQSNQLCIAVADGGSFGMKGGAIKNSSIGVEAKAGAKVSLTGTKFTEVATPTVGKVEQK